MVLFDVQNTSGSKSNSNTNIIKIVPLFLSTRRFQHSVFKVSMTITTNSDSYIFIIIYLIKCTKESCKIQIFELSTSYLNSIYDFIKTVKV